MGRALVACRALGTSRRTAVVPISTLSITSRSQPRSLSLHLFDGDQAIVCATSVAASIYQKICSQFAPVIPRRRGEIFCFVFAFCASLGTIGASAIDAAVSVPQVSVTAIMNK